MNTIQLECFIKVSEYLSFAKASEQLCISQPAVTHQIKSLEEELGVHLFNRTTRYVELTHEGKVFLEDAKRILNISNHALERFNNPENEDIQMINIGICNYGQMKGLTPLLTKLKNKYHHIHPTFNRIISTQILKDIEEGNMDIALCLKDSSYMKNHVQYIELCKMDLYCICHKDYPISKNVDINEMKKHSLVLYQPESAAFELNKIEYELSLGKNPRDLYYCESYEIALNFIEAGYGIGIVPFNFIPDNDHLISYKLDVEPLSYGIYVLKDNVNVIVKECIQDLKRIYEKE